MRAAAPSGNRLAFRVGDHDAAALGHGVAGVDHQVHHRLLDLPGIDREIPQFGIERRRQRDALADQAAQHRLQVAHDLVQVDDARLQHLLAAEGEQLPRQRRGLVAGLLDLVDRHLGVAGCQFVRRLAQQRGVTVDDGEQVVEVVGDAARQAADGVHLLRLSKVRFGAGQRALRLASLQHVARQRADDDHLADHEERGDPDQRLVLGVERTRLSDDHRGRRQPRCVDAPADQLLVVELVGNPAERLERHLRRPTPAQDRGGEASRRQAVLEAGVDAARHLSLAHFDRHRRVGGRRRGRCDPCQRFARRERLSGVIARERCGEQEVARRRLPTQRREHLLEREVPPIHVDHREPTLLPPVGLDRFTMRPRRQRVVRDDEDAARHVEGEGEVEERPDGDHLVHAGEPAARRSRDERFAAHAAEDDGHAGEQLGSVVEQELQRGIVGGDDDRRLPGRVSLLRAACASAGTALRRAAARPGTRPTGRSACRGPRGRRGRLASAHRSTRSPGCRN